MGEKHIDAFFSRQLTIPKKTTGEELYELLEVNPKDELVLLTKPYEPAINKKYLIIPDNRLIELPTANGSSGLPEYFIVILKNELFFKMFDLNTSYPN